LVPAKQKEPAGLGLWFWGLGFNFEEGGLRDFDWGVERFWFQGVGVTSLARRAHGFHGVPARNARARGPFRTPHGRGRVQVAGGHLV